MRSAANRLISPLTMLLIGGVLCAAPGGQATVIPFGTKIAVQTADVIDSDGTNLDAQYNASLADPVMVGSVVVAPKGAPALLRVVQLDKAGAIKGRVSLGIKLVAITIDGRRVKLDTAQATIQSNSQGGKTAKGGIFGGILGAMVGAATGGAGGAAKGAAIGAAAGAGAAAISGVKVHVEKETRLSFTVVDPDAPPPVEEAKSDEATLEGFTVRVDSCKRQRTASVTCELTATNQRADRKLLLQGGLIVDSGANELPAAKLQLGQSKFSESVAQANAVYQKPVRLKLQFGGVTPDIDSLTLTVRFAAPGPSGEVQFDAVFRNVPLPR